MIGYWLVLAIVLCALVAVVAAYAAEEPEPEDTHHPPPRRPDPKHQAWIALGSSGTIENALRTDRPTSWVSLLEEMLPLQAAGHDVSTAHATVAEVRRDQVPAGIGSSPSVAVLWIGLDDLLGGTSIDAFEEDLLAVLARLSAAGCAVVVGTVPDLTGQPELETIGFTNELLRLHVARWNASIARLALALGAAVIDDCGGPEHIAVRVRYLDDPEVFLSERGHARLANNFAPLVRKRLGEHQ